MWANFMKFLKDNDHKLDLIWLGIFIQMAIFLILFTPSLLGLALFVVNLFFIKISYENGWKGTKDINQEGDK